MNAWKVILATLVIFGAGVVTGGLLVSYAVHANSPVPIATAQPGTQTALNPWQLRAQLLHRMVRELNLTTGQREHIEDIIKDSQERTKNLWKPIQGPMNREMQRMFHDVREQLTADQKRKLDELLKARPGFEKRRQLTNSPATDLTNGPPANP